MRTRAQIEISTETTVSGIKAAKEAVNAIKKSVDGGDSALECMELDTYHIYHVTTFSQKSGELKHFKRPCDLRRVTPLQIEVKVQYGRTTLEVSWYAEGSIEDKSCFAEIYALATWKDGWYNWFYEEENGTPEAPLATIYINEENMDD